MISRRHAFRSVGLAVVTVAGFVGFGGCASTQPTASQPAAPVDSNAELTEFISNQAFVTAEPAYRSIHILWKGEPFPGGFSELAAALEQGGIISPLWKHAPNTRLDRAAAGFMLCRACDIRSGLNWQLTGLGRYAWKELQYRRIAGPRSEFGLVSGGEFLGLLIRAEDYLAGRGEYSDRLDLGEEPTR